MTSSCYLILDQHGIVAMRKKEPALQAGEIAVRVRVIVDDDVFNRMIQATLKLDPEDVILPEVEILTDSQYEDKVAEALENG